MNGMAGDEACGNRGRCDSGQEQSADAVCSTRTNVRDVRRHDVLHSLFEVGTAHVAEAGDWPQKIELADFKDSIDVLLRVSSGCEHKLVTGELALGIDMAFKPPEQGMEPEDTDEYAHAGAGQVVVPLDMRKFVKKDGLEFAGGELFGKSLGQQDHGTENAAKLGFDIRAGSGKRYFALDLNVRFHPFQCEEIVR